MAVATACANIALIKYWGKRNVALNTPAAGSLSLTLDRLRTWTEVVRDPSATHDRLELDGQPVIGRPVQRISKFADIVRAQVGDECRVVVRSHNSFPTAAGLASSASAFAALAVATSKAFELTLPPRELSVLARRGSGSAARSIFGGFAVMHEGQAEDGSDAYAEPLEGAGLQLCAAVAVAKSEAKKVGSTDGMELTRTTSPFHQAWIDCVNRDLPEAQSILRRGDFEALSELVEGNCLAMHANAMAARPGILYFRASTLWALEEVRTMRKAGIPAFFTIDAGPHVVAFTTPEYLEVVAQRLGGHPEVQEVLTSTVGDAAHLLQAMP